VAVQKLDGTHDCTAFIETNDAERALPDVDAHRGNGRS